MQRKDFPILKKYTYLDSAASKLKPKQVVKEMNNFYLFYPFNPHNIDFPLGFKLNQKINEIRNKVAKLINGNSDEIIFTSGTTDSLNQIVKMIKPLLKPGDEIVLSPFNHDSNLVPWIALSQEIKVKLIYSDNIIEAINQKTKIISYSQMNNTLQKYLNKKALYKKAKAVNAILINDAAQAISHEKVTFEEADVIVFSGNKLYGPTGIGVLAIKQNWLDKMTPINFGGGAINEIKSNNWTFKTGIERFEPGTLNIAGIIGLGKAIDYFKSYEWHKSNEIELAKYAYEKLTEIPGIKIYSRKGDLNILFNIKHYFAQDVASYLGNRNIIVRAGKHCAHLLNETVDIIASIRISISAYNEPQDINNLVKTLIKGGDFLDIE